MANFDGFVGQAYEAPSITQDGQRLINWYPEVDPTKFRGAPEEGIPAQRGVIALYPTPGLVTRAELQYGEVRGFWLASTGVLYAVSANKLYSFSGYTPTHIGTLLTSTGIVYMTDNGTSLYITDGLSRYYYTWATSTFSQIADGAFTGADCCGILDNFIFYNRPGANQFGCTDAGSVNSNALNSGAKLIAPDYIRHVVANNRQLLLLGAQTSERWTDVGGSPFPFAVVPGTSIQHGIQAPNSVARLGESVAYLALDDRGQATVIMWGATLQQPMRISTYAIENAIQNYEVTEDAIGYSYSMSGHEFYMLTFPTEDVTWCYDLSSQMWHQRAWRDSNNVLHRHRSNCAVAYNGEILVGDFQNGKVYAFSERVYTDDGDLIPCIRRAPHLTNDLRRQFFSDFQVQFQPGVGLQTGQGEDPECILRWSNDGGHTFGNDHTIKLGRVGQYTRRAMKRRLGSARDRVFEIEMTDPVYRVVVSANMNVTVAAN